MTQTVEKEDVVCLFSVTEVLVRGMRSSESYHFHSFYELFAVTNGQVRLIVDHQDIILRSGEVCIIPPNITHYVYEQEDAFCVGFLFDFAPSKKVEDTKLFGAFQMAFGSLKGATVTQFGDMYGKYLKLTSCALENDEPAYAVAELLFLQLDYVRRLLCTADSEKTPLQNNDRFLAMAVERYMNTCYADRPKIEELAKQLGFSVRQTQRILKRLFDMNFSQLLIKKRVSTACFLLTDTRYSLEQVAEMSGFCSLSHLCRHFKALVGVSPSQYRFGRIENASLNNFGGKTYVVL